MKRIHVMQGVEAMAQTRAVDITYGTRLLRGVEVEPFSDQVVLAYAGALKAIAVGAGVLGQIPCEEALTGSERLAPAFKATLLEEVCAQARRGRTEIATLLGDNAVTSADALMNLVQKEAPACERNEQHKSQQYSVN